MRKLATIRKIDALTPIEGADAIEAATIGGWKVVVKKGEFTVGDMAVYCEIDSWIPTELAPFLSKGKEPRVYEGIRGERLRTVKLRGVYSECLIIPAHYAKGRLTMGNPDLKEGQDMMQALEIYKWEPPVKQIQLSSGRKIRYSENPNFHVYHKFPNMKNVKGMFTEEDTVEITRKIHGTNARYGIVKKKKLSIIDRVKILFGF